MHRHTITHKSTHSQPHINLLEVLQDVLLGNRQKKAQTNGLCTTKGGLASVNKSTSFFYLLRHLLNKFQLFAKIVLRTSHKHTHALTRTNAQIHTQVPTICKYRLAHQPQTHTCTHTRAHTHTHTHTHTNAQIQKNTHTYLKVLQALLLRVLGHHHK